MLRQQLKKILFSFIVITILFVILELALRLLGLPLQKDLIQKFRFPTEEMYELGFRKHSTRFWSLAPNYNGSWRMYKYMYTYEKHITPIEAKKRSKNIPCREYFKSVTWNVNEQGFRGELYDPKKRIILFLGSSVTFGWGVQSKDCFAALLEDKLSRKGYHNWDVINAGVPGYSSYQSLLYLTEILEQCNPEVVIVEAGINDGIISTGLSDRQTTISKRQSWIDKISWSSNMILAFRYMLQGISTQKACNLNVEAKPFFHTSMFTPGKSRVPEKDFLNNIKKCEELIESRRASLFFIFPGLYNEYGKGKLQKSVRFNHPREINITSKTISSEVNNLKECFLPYDEAHLSQKGHQLLANLIWTQLEKEKLFTFPIPNFK